MLAAGAEGARKGPELSAELFRSLATEHPVERHPNPELVGCAVSAAWTDGLAGGCPKYGSWAKNPQFHLYPSRPTKVTIELRQEMNAEGKGYGIGFIVLKAEDESAPKTSVVKAEMVFYTKPYKASKRIEAKVSLVPRKGGLPYIVIPSTYEPNQRTGFTLAVATDDADLRFGWLGCASRVLSGPRVPPSRPVPAAAAAGAGAGAAALPDNEVRVENQGAALSKNQERQLERMVADAISWCEQHDNAPYEDAAFPAENGSLWGGAMNQLGLPAARAWLRPHELPAVREAGETACLFKPRSEIEGVQRGGGSGALGNGYFLSACNIVAGSKEAIDRVFYYPKRPATQPPAEKSRGFFVVGFFHDDPNSDDDWELVLVDDRIPCDESGVPLFARCVSAHTYWVMIVEKAFAKLSGSYASMQGGTVQAALEMLTGGEPTKLDLTHPATLERLTNGASAQAELSDSAQRENLLRAHLPLWEQLVEALKVQPPQVVGCVYKTKAKEGRLTPTQADIDKRTASGIQPDEVYCVVGCLNYDGTKMMRLRQLHGDQEWNGKWSDGSAAWTGNMRQMLNYADNSSDGTFWMQYEDFVCAFNKVYFARMAADLFTKLSVRSRWADKSAGGSPAYISWRSNYQWLLDVPKRTQITVVLSIEDPRRATGSGNKAGLKTAIGFGVYKGNARTADRRRRRLTAEAADVVASAEPRLVRKVVKNITLEPSRVPYVLVPYTAHPGRESAFKLALISDDREDDGQADFGMEPVRPQFDWRTTALQAAWEGQAAGGAPGSAAFWSNPQFELTLTKQARVFIYLEPIAVSQDTRDEAGIQETPWPTVGFALYEGTGPYCKLHADAPGKRLEQSAVQRADGVMLEKTLDGNGGKPYILIPFLAAPPPGGGPQSFYITVYSDAPHTFQPVGERPDCVVCERMQVVLDRLLLYERQVDERIAALESESYLADHTCTPCGGRHREAAADGGGGRGMDGRASVLVAPSGRNGDDMAG